MSSTQIDPHQNLFIIEDKCLITSKVTKYIKGHFLGKGGFARCYQIRKQDTNEIFAVKIIQKCNLTKPRSKQKLASEIQIHETLKHQNIVQFKHTFQDNLNVYILLELCPNQTMNDLLKQKRKLNEAQLQYYILQLLDALIYLHNKKIIHRDLKLGNLFLAQKSIIKLGDFGLASKIQFYGDKRKTICGTPNYIAPQILEAKGHSYQVDIWSLGVIMYTLTFGRPPFQAKDVKQTYKKIKMNLYSFPQTVNASPVLKDLISTILQKEPNKRPTLNQIKQHQFFKGTAMSRQPSASKSFKTQNSSINLQKTTSIKQKQTEFKNQERSDNGKLYTNNEICRFVVGDNQQGISRQDLKKQKSYQKFTNTERKVSCFKTPVKQQRVKSQRLIKQKLIGDEDYLLLTNQQISVKKWIDYSSKYGIGYLLNNKIFGVYFNDSTKMLAQDEIYFFYVQKVLKQDIPKKYSFLDYPPQLKKKVGLFNHFKGYLKIDEQKKKQMVGSIKSNLDINNLVYIKRWFRSKHAVIFRMNNKTVQVIFVDQTEIIINSFSKTLIYYNKDHEKSIYAIHEIMQSGNKELIKRFQYTKQVLNQMTKAHEQKRQEPDVKRKQSDKKENMRQKSLFSNIDIKQEKILEQKDNFMNTMQTPVKAFNETRIAKFSQTTGVRKGERLYE